MSKKRYYSITSIYIYLFNTYTYNKNHKFNNLTSKLINIYIIMFYLELKICFIDINQVRPLLHNIPLIIFSLSLSVLIPIFFYNF